MTRCHVDAPAPQQLDDSRSNASNSARSTPEERPDVGVVRTLHGERGDRHDVVVVRVPQLDRGVRTRSPNSGQ